MQETSIKAYRSVKDDGTISKHHARILTALEFLPGNEGTAFQISQRVTGLDSVQCSRRLKELVVKGLIEDTGRKGLSGSGRAANIYQLSK